MYRLAHHVLHVKTAHGLHMICIRLRPGHLSVRFGESLRLSKGTAALFIIIIIVIVIVIISIIRIITIIVIIIIIIIVIIFTLCHSKTGNKLDLLISPFTLVITTVNVSLQFRFPPSGFCSASPPPPPPPLSVSFLFFIGLYIGHSPSSTLLSLAWWLRRPHRERKIQGLIPIAQWGIFRGRAISEA